MRQTFTRLNESLPNCLPSLEGLVEFEFFLPVAIFFQRFLLFFIQHKIFQHESIHFRTHETTVGLFRGADNGLPANIEGGIDQYRALRGFFKLPDQIIEFRIGFGIDRKSVV